MNFEPTVNLGERNPKALQAFFNVMPCFAGSGGRISHMSDDLREVVVTVPLDEKTRNAVGTIYGGSMYSASDAIYMMLLWFQLGSEYLLFDRSAKVDYRRPGMSEVTAVCSVSEEEVETIKELLKEKSSCLRDYVVDFVDGAGKVVCHIEKQVYIRKNVP